MRFVGGIYLLIILGMAVYAMYLGYTACAAKLLINNINKELQSFNMEDF